MNDFRYTVLTEFDELLKKLKEQRPEVTQEQIDQMIQEKKEKIGAGYLTDQGALFLIASDLGVTLTEQPKTEVGLKDLPIGAKEITVQTRVMNLSQPKEFSRKDGGTFLLRTMTVYDGDTTGNVKLWDEKANLPGVDQLKPGDLIKIIKAYVKADRDGTPSINVGSGATIETTNDTSDIPSIDSITKDVDTLEPDLQNIVVSGTVDGSMKTIRFTNSRGQPAKALNMGLKGSDGNTIRAVIWGKDDAELPAVIAANAKARLLGVRTKGTEQGIEIHGNESTIIEIEGSQDAQPMTVRIISKTQTDAGNILVLCMDEQQNPVYIADTAKHTQEFVNGDVIECVPSKMYGNSVTLDDSAFARKVDDSSSIPKREELRTKLGEIQVGGNYCIEGIILQLPGRKEVQTKNGTVALSEMYIEDDTGQVWVKGWRNQAKMIDKCQIGEIVSITDLNARSGLEDRVDLMLSPYSDISVKS